jgi:hypothetical protein
MRTGPEKSQVGGLLPALEQLPRPRSISGWCGPRNASQSEIELAEMRRMSIPANRYLKMGDRRGPAGCWPGRHRAAPARLLRVRTDTAQLQERAGWYRYGSPSRERPAHAGATSWSSLSRWTRATPTSSVPSDCSAECGNRAPPGERDELRRPHPFRIENRLYGTDAADPSPARRLSCRGPRPSPRTGSEPAHQGRAHLFELAPRAGQRRFAVLTVSQATRDMRGRTRVRPLTLRPFFSLTYLLAC